MAYSEWISIQSRVYRGALPRREFEEEMLVEYAKWEAKGNGFQSLVISSSSDYYFLA
jgi:hypothetical protein